MDVDTNTLYVGSNGKITEVIVEDFGEDYYDEDELKSYIDDAVASYQEENGIRSEKRCCASFDGV